MALKHVYIFAQTLTAKEFCKSVRCVTVADDLQQNSTEISILPKVATRYVA